MPLKGHTSFAAILLFAITLVAVCEVQSEAQPAVPQTSPSVERAAALVTEGASALERNDVAQAQSFFTKALEINPGDAAAHTYLGIIADRAGDLATAENHFAAAKLSDPRSPSAHNNHGAVLLKLGRNQEAAAEFVASLKLDRNQTSASVNLAQIRLASGTTTDLREARELFQQAYDRAPDTQIARALVVVALRLGEQQAAANYYRQYSTNVDTARPRSASERSELGAALLQAGLASEAVVELNAALSEDPSQTETILRLARAYLALKNVPAAGRTLEGAVARGLDTAPIYALLASVYEQSGHIENAIPAMRLAIQRDPKSETYRFTYGMLLTSVLAPEAAVIRLKEALEVFPESPRLWCALGIAHFRVGRNEEAATCLKRSVELDPKYAPALAYLGMTYVEIGQYEQAIKSYEQARQVNEKLGVVDFLIADVLLKQQSPDLARVETHLRRAVKLEPEFARAQLELGKLFLRTNRLAEAATELEQVIKLDPNLAECYYQLGLLYKRLKRPADAQTAVEKFKQLSETQKEQALKDRKEIVSRLAPVLF